MHKDAEEMKKVLNAAYAKATVDLHELYCMGSKMSGWLETQCARLPVIRLLKGQMSITSIYCTHCVGRVLSSVWLFNIIHLSISI